MKTKFIFLITGLLFNFTTYATSVNELTKQNWDSVILQAKNEGSVTFNIWYLQPQWRSFVKQFEDAYGIKVNIPEGTIEGNTNKLLAEAKREKGKMDVVALSVGQLPASRKTQALAKIDWLPYYSQAIHHLQSVDTEGYAVAFWGNQTGFAYDPAQMKNQSLPQTIDELQAFINANPQRFGYNDPNNGGAGDAFIQQIVTSKSGSFDSQNSQIEPTVVQSWQKGWQWFIDNKDKIIQTASGADSLTRLNDGELFLVPAWEDHLLGLQHTGAITSRLKFYVPQFGMPSGGNIIGIANNSPHPAASAVFVNWLVQPETQMKLKETFGTIPMGMQLDRKQLSENKVHFFGKEYSVILKKAFVQNVTMK
ncbi:extracellular solute-binding protein [Providencia stuartii]|uniref:extracellular solute-binding protein n=1 Tax=Providencia stuartii TaxID=588 RepID=UPI00300CF557